jgi:multiple RNA-binding domain-containing protein 1
VNFKTNDSTLRRVFDSVGSVRSVSIATKTVGGGDGTAGKTLSRGYGFVEFSDSNAALRALKKLQGTMVDGHVLQLKVSNRQSTEKQAGSKKRELDRNRSSGTSSTKIVVKNVPFEASVKELRDLFATFGQVKSCRIPKKFGGGHRGFAFVEFTTKQEARSAIDSLSSTHLYGRHLVLGWAEDAESLDDLREKA